jgi:hypothetical protein
VNIRITWGDGTIESSFIADKDAASGAFMNKFYASIKKAGAVRVDHENGDQLWPDPTAT